MFYKYLKLVMISTVLIHAAPMAFSSLGNELEEFQGDCHKIQKISGISVKIDEACNTYHLQLNKAFDTGYKLDPAVEQENVNEKALHNYLSKLRDLDKRKLKILDQLYSEARKAREENNFGYYGDLITNYKVELYDSDYEFLGKYAKHFSTNSRYLSNMKYIRSLEEKRLQKEKAQQAQYKVRKKKKVLESGLTIVSMDLVSPKAFHSLGNELEEFKEDCHKIKKISGISAKIDEACNKYDKQLTKAFDVGFRLDASVEQESVNEKVLLNYLSKLRHLDKRKVKILDQLYSEARKARKQNNFGYYGDLITNYKVKLFDSDYTYMEKYKILFYKHPRYIAHNKHLRYLEEERLKRERAKRGHKKNQKVKKHRVSDY